MNDDGRNVTAKFGTQEQAEAAMRKLASLRGDRFRLERMAAGSDVGPSAVEFAGTLGEMNAAAEAAFNDWGAVPPGGADGGAFALSVSLPPNAVERARSVIEANGGTIV